MKRHTRKPTSNCTYHELSGIAKILYLPPPPAEPADWWKDISVDQVIKALDARTNFMLPRIGYSYHWPEALAVMLSNDDISAIWRFIPVTPGRNEGAL